MKKNLFTKFLALFLAGTMLAGVGCKNYDDDIDDINKRLDGIDVTIASLPEQIQSIQNTIQGLSALTQKVATLEGQVAGIGDVKAQLSALETSLKEYTDNKVGAATSAEALKATLGSYYATTTKLNEVETALADITKAGGKIDASILTAITDLKADAANWMGPKMANYLSANGYADKNTTVSEATAKAEADILLKIQTEQSAYYKAIEAIIGKAKITNLGTAVVKSEHLDPALKELIEKIQPLLDRVAALEGRIQSLIFVPSNTSEAMLNIIQVAGSPYIELAGFDEPITLVAKNKPEIEITYRVSPASLAEMMTAETVSFLFDKIETDINTRAVESPSFTVTEVKNQDKVSGKFTVVATTDYEFGAEDKTLAVALNVKLTPEQGSESAHGIDYNSAYVTLMPIGSQLVNDDLVIALNPNDEQHAILLDDGATYATELKYDDAAKQEFLKNVSVYYKSGSKYILADQLWEGISIDIQKPAAADKATVSAHAANYTLTNLDAAIAKKDVALIGDVITSKGFKFGVKYTAGTTSGTAVVGAVNQTITVVGTNATYAAEKAATLNWNYTTATASNAYKASTVKLAAGLQGEIYNAMKLLTPAKISIKKDNVDVSADIQVGINLPSSPDNASSSDTENLEITLTGDMKSSADYAIEVVYMLADNTYVTLTATVQVEGMPALAEQTIVKTFDYKSATKTYTAKENYADGLWNEAWKGKFFTDKAEFEGVIYAMTGTGAKGTGNKAELSKNGKNIDVKFDNDAKGGTVYKPSILFKDATTDLSVNFKSNVDITLPTAVLTDNMSLGTDGRAKANATINGSTYTISGFKLLEAYSYTGAVAGTQTVFTINDIEIAKKASIANNELNWGTYDGMEIPIKAELKLDGYVLDTKIFKVYITNPIKDSAIAVKAGELEASTAQANDIMLASLLTLNADIATNANVFEAKADGLNADLKQALGATVKYTLITKDIDLAAKNLTFDNATGTLTVGKFESLTPVQQFSLQFEVVYKYRFGERKATVTVSVKPESEKPAIN